MSDAPSSSFDLHIGVQQIKYEIPNNFKYTKFCSIKPGKLFQSKYFQMNDLIAAGTTDGPILVYADNFDLLSQVCLLCAHKSSITDIIQMENNYFVSSSSDGTLVKWSNDDCSFIESFPQIAAKGDILLSHHQPNPDFLWINTIGFSTFLFDLKNGVKIRSFKTFGITKVSFLHPDKCFFLSSPILAILKFNLYSVYSYTDNDQPPQLIRDFAINANDNKKFFLSEYGLFRTEEREWELFSPDEFKKKFGRKVKGRIKGDFISNIKWSNQTTFCVSTFGSRFVIYSLDIIKPNGIAEVRSVTAVNLISPIESICNNFLFYLKSPTTNSNFAKIFADSKKVKLDKTQSDHLSDDNANSPDSNLNDCCIVFSPKSQKVYSMRANGTFSENFFNDRPKMYHVPRASSARFIETDGNCAFYVRNWEKGGNESLKHVTSSRITSIASRESQNSELEIIVGCQDGTVSFFSENKKKPSRTEIVLSSPIIGLANLPFKHRGLPTLLAIGEDGSSALLKKKEVMMLYANFMMKVDAAFYHKDNKCIIFHRVDESYISFKFDEPGPVSFTSALPEGALLIWSLNEMQSETDNNNLQNKNEFSSLSTNAVKFGRNSWFYSSVGISKFLNVQHRRYKLFAKFINNLFQQKSEDSFPHSRSLNFSSANADDLSNLNTHIDNDSDIDSDSDSEPKKIKLIPKPPINKTKKVRVINSNLLASSSNDSSSNNFSSSTISQNSKLSSIPSPSPYAFSEFPKSQSIQSIVDWISPEKTSLNFHQTTNPLNKIIQGLSLVILGDNKKKATFFYPDYRICGNMAFILSDKNSVINMIIKALISGETAEEQHPELLPEFADLLSCRNDNIEMAASFECDILINFIDVQTAQKLIQSIREDTNLKNQNFVLSIIAFIHPDLISRKIYQDLLYFLESKTMSNQASSSLALSILVRGFDFWSNVESNSGREGKVNLFVRLIDCFIRADIPKHIEEIFFDTAIKNLDSFKEGMLIKIGNRSYLYPEIIKKLIDLMSKIAFFDPQRCGIQITTMLVDIASQFNDTSLIADEIGTHSIFFTSVSIMNNFIVIGGKDGIVSVYKDFKLIASERLFNSAVDYVSIGPTAIFCAVISVAERKAIIFALPSQGLANLFHKRSGTEADLGQAGGHYKIYWSDPTRCHFTVVD